MGEEFVVSVVSAETVGMYLVVETGVGLAVVVEISVLVGKQVLQS
jgi:hypothetical protein